MKALVLRRSNNGSALFHLPVGLVILALALPSA